MEFTDEEAATLLAGLCMVQDQIKRGWDETPWAYFVHGVYTDFGEFDGLTMEETNQLRKRINGK